jgi:hypothetical protein
MTLSTERLHKGKFAKRDLRVRYCTHRFTEPPQGYEPVHCVHSLTMYIHFHTRILRLRRVSRHERKPTRISRRALSNDAVMARTNGTVEQAKSEQIG